MAGSLEEQKSGQEGEARLRVLNSGERWNERRKGEELGTMHSFAFRANAVLTVSITVLVGLWILASFSDVLHFSHPDIHVEVLNVDVLQKSNIGNDEAWLTLNISADLRSVFTWNTKQMFVSVAAEYATKENELNQVSLWDRIVKKKKDARIVSNCRVRNNYLFEDQGSHLKGQDFNLTMYWNVIPLRGRMVTEKRIVTGFHLPLVEYIQ